VDECVDWIRKLGTVLQRIKQVGVIQDDDAEMIRCRPRLLSPVMLSPVMLSPVMLSPVILSLVMLSGVEA
jgi:hypothetical protein